MAHHVYHTEGLILESKNVGEANKSYSIFTRELGMVEASAQGVRFLKSKLRFSLQPFTLVHISLVRGRLVWKIVNAEASQNLYQTLKPTPQKLLALARVHKLLRRLIQGEEKNERLFKLLIEAFQLIETVPATDVEYWEYLVVLDMLHILGYIPQTKNFDHFVLAPIQPTLIEEMKKYKREVIQSINTALKESHL